MTQVRICSLPVSGVDGSQMNIHGCHVHMVIRMGACTSRLKCLIRRISVHAVSLILAPARAYPCQERNFPPLDCDLRNLGWDHLSRSKIIRFRTYLNTSTRSVFRVPHSISKLSRYKLTNTVDAWKAKFAPILCISCLHF